MTEAAPVAAPKTRRPKRWWHRRALWLNAIVLALAAAEAQLQILQPLLSVDVYQILAFVLPVANAVLATWRRKAVSP